MVLGGSDTSPVRAKPWRGWTAVPFAALMAAAAPAYADVVATPSSHLQQAIAALRQGGQTVRLGPGRYNLHGVRIASGSKLIGAGNATVIAASGSYQQILLVRGSRITLSSLAIDGGGGGAHATGWGPGRAIEVMDGSSRISMSHLTITHVRASGIFLYGNVQNVAISACSISSDGSGAGGILDYGNRWSRNVVVSGCHVARFRGWGIGFFQSAYDVPHAAYHNVARHNLIEDITDPSKADGTSEGGIWTGGVAARIVGNTIRRTGWDGIETVGSSSGTVIRGNRISQTRTGIYLEHKTTRTRVDRNLIDAVRTGINVEWTYGGVSSDGNRFRRNRISNAGNGIFIDVGDDANTVAWNAFVGTASPVVLQGSSHNLVRSNRACGVSAGAIVREQVGLWDTGARAHATGNRVSGNLSRC
jgi:parallel beta-helix repeat protein